MGARRRPVPARRNRCGPGRSRTLVARRSSLAAYASATCSRGRVRSKTLPVDAPVPDAPEHVGQVGADRGGAAAKPDIHPKHVLLGQLGDVGDADPADHPPAGAERRAWVTECPFRRTPGLRLHRWRRGGRRRAGGDDLSGAGWRYRHGTTRRCVHGPDEDLVAVAHDPGRRPVAMRKRGRNLPKELAPRLDAFHLVGR